MANSTAEFLRSWNSFMKDVVNVAKRALAAATSSIKGFVSNIGPKGNQLANSFSKIEEGITTLQNAIKGSSSKSDIKRWAKDLEKLQKVLEKHPGNPDNYDKEKRKAKKKKDAEDDNALVKWTKGLFKTDSLISLGKSILTKGMAEQKSVAALTPQLKGGAAGAYANIKKDAAATPFDLESVFAANKALIDAGVSANDARTNVLALGEAVAFKGGGNEELTKAAELMAKIKDAGKAGKDELDDLGAAGIDVYKALSEFAGKNIEGTKDMNVSYQDLTAALQKAGAAGGAFAGAMETQNKTASAGMDNFMETLDGGLAQIGVAFTPVLSKIFTMGMKVVTELLPKIMQVIQPIVNILSTLPIDALLKDISTWLGVVMTAIGPILQNLQPLFTAIFDALQPVIHALYELGAVMVSVLGPRIAAIAKVISVVLSPIIWALGKIITWVLELLVKILNFFKPIADNFTKFIGKIADYISRFSKWIGLDKLMSKDKDPKAADDPGKSGIPTADNLALPSFTAEGTSLAAAGTAANPAMTGKSSVEKTSDKTASEITSGGPRVININGVKFTEKIELHVTNAKEGLYDLELKLQEMFLRILNSGAVLQ